jgi:hypothetical protein
MRGISIRNFGLGAAAAAGLLLMTACPPPPPPGVVYVRAAPPAAQIEVVGTAPGPDFLWVRGYHRWDGAAYVWVPGRWERRPHAGAVWVDGHWSHHHNGWYWRDGYWR